MMPRSVALAAATLLVACGGPPSVVSTAAPASVAPTPPPARTAAASPGTTASATLRDLAGTRIGTVVLTDTPSGLLIAAAVSGVGLGAHGVHIHETGKCIAPFASAGGHFNPASHHHGFRSASGPHLGDLPNIDMPAAGVLKFEFLVAGVTLKGANPLLDSDGASIVIHSARDDYVTDPAGNSGSRLACGVVVGR